MAGGAWTVLKFVLSDRKPKIPPPSSVIAFRASAAPVASAYALHSSVAVTGDVRESTIHVGLNEQETGRRVTEATRPLVERLEALTEQVARDKGVPIAPLRAILFKLGEARIPDYEILARLDAAADELLGLRAQLVLSRNDRPELAAIREQALSLINAGDLDAARAMLNCGRAMARALREEASRNEAELLADQSHIDHLQLAYQDAAAKYAEAAAMVAPFDRQRQWKFLMQQATELYHQGSEFGDNDALTEAIIILKTASSLYLAPSLRQIGLRR